MESTVAAGTGIIGLLLFGFCVILAVLAILMPLFVYRIRNEIIEANEKLSQAVQCLQGLVALSGGIDQKPVTDSRYKKCPKCGTKNRRQDYSCMNCSSPLV